MRRRYSASFCVGPQAGPAPSMLDVSKLCIDWILKGGRTALPDGATLEPGAELARQDLGKGAWLESITASDQNACYWAMRFGHPDEYDERFEWHTEVCVSESADPHKTTFTCANLVGSRTGLLAPMRRTPSRPRIVRDILRQWGGHQGHDLACTPVELAVEAVDDFVALLRSPQRRRPVILVSAENFTDKPVIDAGKLADWVGGVAHVFVTVNRFPSFGLSDRLQRRLGCWDGAVRLYWPGLVLSDDSFRHPVWSPDRVREHEKALKHGFTEYLLGLLSEEAVYISDPDAPSWSGLEALRRKRLVEQARLAGDEHELLALAEEEIRDMSESITSLKAQLAEKAEDLKQAQAREESWRQAYIEVCKAQGGEQQPAEDAQPVVPLESVADAIDRATRDFTDQVALELNGQSDGAESLYERPDEVYAALEFLAVTYYRTKMGIERCDDLDTALRGANGWKYMGHHSHGTMRKYDNWYSTKVGKRTLWLTEHMGTGSGKDPRHTIRIGFCWDNDCEKVVIGFIGQHQETDAT